MYFKSEFRIRLLRLRNALNSALDNDEVGYAEHYGNLFPYLFSVLSYLWSFKMDSNILKK